MLRLLTEAQTIRFAISDAIRGFLADEAGSTASEYALIGTGIALAIIGALFAIGDLIVGVFTDVQNELVNAGS